MRRKHLVRLSGLLFVLCFMLMWFQVTWAQDCAAEAEPNDDPASAGTITGCAVGRLTEDDQDFYSFTVTAADEQQFFTFSVGIAPGIRTVVEVLRLTDDGSTQRLFSFFTPDGSKVSTADVLLAPGDYLLAIVTTGSGEYTLSVDPGGRLPQPGETEPNDSRDMFTPIDGTIDISGGLADDEDWYAWTIPDASPENRWQLSAQTQAGTALNMRLHDSANRLLAQVEADAHGYASLPDLSLAGGTYRVRLVGRSGMVAPYRLSTEMRAAFSATYEHEPNNTLALNEPWALSDLKQGRLAAPADSDFYGYTIDDTQVSSLHEFILESDSRESRRICLQAVDASNVAHCRTGLGVIELVDLALPAGAYAISIEGVNDPGETYTLSSRTSGMVMSGVEAEPNDTHQNANALGEGLRARGRLSGDERDVFHLFVDGEPQLWRIQAIGDGITDLTYINPAGQREQSVQAGDRGRARLTNLYFLPGSHFIEVGGNSGDYRLVAMPLGPPPSGMELEPNNSLEQSDRLRFGEVRTGLLDETDDEDYYRFSLAAETHVMLTITPPDDGLIESWLYWENLIVGGNQEEVAGKPLIFESILSAGDYSVRLVSPDFADSPYTIFLEQADPFAVVADREPNNSLSLASKVPASLLLRGTVGTMNDDDWYVLPVIEDNTTLEIHSSTRHDLRLYDAQSTILDDLPWDADRQSYTLTLDAGAAQPFHFRVAGRGTYEFQLDFGTALEAHPLQDLDAALEVVVPDDQVAAHWYVGQVVSGILHIANSSPESLTLLLDGHSSHHKVNIHFDETEITLPPETSRELPIRFLIADDLPLGNYPITIRGRTATGGQTTTNVKLSALADAPAVESERVWSMPASMLGGLNAAALSLGAEIITEDQSLLAEQRDLHDGYTALADGFRADARELPLILTVQLAGSDPIPVTGILLNPQSEGQGPQKLQDFELWLSPDGQTYTFALADRLSALPIEQAFPLAEPTVARYAQLRLLSNHQGNNGNVELGEWKVVTAPGTPLVNRVNIADPQHGGYVVYNLPQHQQATEVASLLVEDQAGYSFRLSAGAAAEWVLGFQNDRAAQITEIEWIEAPDTRPDERLSELSVWISEESPVGPWVSVGSWSLTTGTNHFSFPAPAWARYVRLVTPSSAQEIPLSAPDAIRIWEQQTDESYLSIIGEWGHYHRSGIYEWLHPVDLFPLEASADANDNREQAIVLDAGQSAHGQTQIGEDVDWYRIDVPEGQNAVSLHLTAFPTVRVRALFEDREGNPLPVTMENVSPGEQILTALAPSSTSIYFRIEEAPRSIIFAWDTSASVSSHYDTIYSSLTTFIEGVSPGREIVNFLPFGGNLLLENWGEQPASLQQALNDYNRTHNSSNVEGALLTATEALATGEGSKAIIIITDAVSGNYISTTELWKALNVVHPRIFALHLSSQISVGEKPANEQDLMQSWASVNAGYYDFLRNQADMETAFERAVVWLRRPADYTVIVDVLYVEPPGPGTLQVSSRAANEDDDSRQSELLRNITVEIIVDASGSMMAPLNGQRRIDVAKAALLDLTDRVLPEGTPVALRVFGNREGNYSCRTDLELPLQPLDRAEIGDIIQEVTPQTNASTAIAASLLHIPDDLAGVSAQKTVILLTDGMETCEGDPRAAILTLLEQGIDVQVNIVGFAITDESLRTQFAEWAQLSGGQYFDAGNPEELSASLAAAVRVPYRVLDSEGTVVAEGRVDSEPVAIPAGTYRVEVLTEPPRIIEGVTIIGEEEFVLELQELR